jgi:hypothetical protein
MEEFKHPLCPNGMTNAAEAYDDEKWKGQAAIQLTRQLEKRHEEILKMINDRLAAWNVLDDPEENNWGHNCEPY